MRRATLLRNRFTEMWDGREDELVAEATTVGEEWKAAYAAGDADGSNVVIGEAIGLIQDIRPAKDVIAQLVEEARDLLEARNAAPHSSHRPLALSGFSLRRSAVGGRAGGLTRRRPRRRGPQTPPLTP